MAITFTDLDSPPISPTLGEELDKLVEINSKAAGPVMKALNFVGGQAESQLAQLPQEASKIVNDVTERALYLLANAAHKTAGANGGLLKGVSPPYKVMAIALGAVGGAGGVVTAAIEIPATVTLLLRSIEDAAAENGLDTTKEDCRKECIQVFAAGGPLEEDDGSNTAFLATRIAVRGTSMNALVASVAPRLTTVLSQKLGAQLVPVLGAATGATINLVYTRYYQDMARVHFGLMRLAKEHGLKREELVEEFRKRVAERPRRPRVAPM